MSPFNTELDTFFEPPERATPQERRLWTRAKNVVREVEFRKPEWPEGRRGREILTAKDLAGIEPLPGGWIRHKKSGIEVCTSSFGPAAARVLRVAIRRARESLKKK